MEQDLFLILSRPFQTENRDKTPKATRSASPKKSEIEENIENFASFEKNPAEILSSNIRAIQLVQEKIFSDKTPKSIRELFDPYKDEFIKNFDLIENAFNIYVNSADDKTLEKEAEKFKHRYFPKAASIGQIRFIKAVRFYEKIKSFNETSKKIWYDVYKLLDLFTTMTETRTLVLDVQKGISSEINKIQHQTDILLNHLRNFIDIKKEKSDFQTHNYTVEANYNPTIDYNLSEFYADIKGENKSHENKVEDEVASSIAKNIVIETKERRLNRYRIFATILLGSRDWNRSPAYSLELLIEKYEEGLKKFKNAYQSNYDPKNIKASLSAVQAYARAGEAEDDLEPYINMILNELENISESITKEDYPGIENPEVFLYHCGPNTFYNILLHSLYQKKIGEIFYMDSGNNLREIPEEIIKKTLIDYWNKKMESLTSDDVDSYITYSRAVDMIKKNYRNFLNRGMEMKKIELPHATYSQSIAWIQRNQNRIFGTRKIEIFKRFLSETILTT